MTAGFVERAMNRFKRSLAPLCFLAVTLAGTPAFAHIDFSGEWPADSWDADRISVVTDEV
jgi:hypothetical protein